MILAAVHTSAATAAKPSGIQHFYGYAVVAVVGFILYKLVKNYTSATRANLISKARAEGKAEAVAEARASATQSVAVNVGDSIGSRIGHDDGPFFLHRDGESLRLVRLPQSELRESGTSYDGGVRSLPDGLRSHPATPGSADGAVPARVRRLRSPGVQGGNGVKP